VIGEAGGKQPLVLTRHWEGVAGRPDSQETTSGRKADNPRGKGWLMSKHHVFKAGAIALATAGIAFAPSAASAATAPTVTVSVQGKTKTLLPVTTVHTKLGSITRGGVAAGKCPATSAQGALNVATHGNWKGTWYASYHEYFITGILGDNETSKKYYWSLVVNGKASSKGACDVKLKNGDKVLFKVTKA
jgi:Domain of unknown function (DUF4430)